MGCLTELVINSSESQPKKICRHSSSYPCGENDTVSVICVFKLQWTINGSPLISHFRLIMEKMNMFTCVRRNKLAHLL